jgi:hypothetical protein
MLCIADDRGRLHHVLVGLRQDKTDGARKVSRCILELPIWDIRGQSFDR